MGSIAKIFWSIVFFSAFISTGFSETLILSDDFSTGFGNNWTVGTNTEINSSPEVAIREGRVEWTQQYDYIETSQAFAPPFRVEVDLERTQGSVRCKDFVVELVNGEELSGVLRLQYGTRKEDSLNLGKAPALSASGSESEGVCVEDATGYQAEMPTLSPHQGTAILTYEDGKIKFSFTNTNGDMVETPWKQAGNIDASKIRIWATSNFRFVDAVRIYSSGSVVQNPECSSVDLNNFDIQIPCIMIDGVKYQLQFNYDPAIPNGLYWKLDLNSLKAAE